MKNSSSKVKFGVTFEYGVDFKINTRWMINQTIHFYGVFLGAVMCLMVNMKEMTKIKVLEKIKC